MKQLLKKLFCNHKYKMDGEPYLYNTGMTKRANFICVKCGKSNNFDIFTVPNRKIFKEKQGGTI